jgi:hypothetical protein
MFAYLRARHAAVARLWTAIAWGVGSSAMAPYSGRSAKGCLTVTFFASLILLADAGHSAGAEGLAFRQLVTQVLSGNKDLQASRFGTAQARASGASRRSAEPASRTRQQE